jgi:RimJ/RimL family protein N-acetyltransferase
MPVGDIEPREFTLKTGERCLVRSAVCADAPMLIENAQKLLVDSSPNVVTLPEEFDLTVEQEENWIENHREKPGWIALVPEIDGHVVGLLNFENGPRQRLAHRGSLGMGINAEWRGRGVGDALLTVLLDWARANPLIEKVCLAVVVTNKPGLGLYKKHGFVEEGRRVKEIKLGPDDYVDDILMYRLTPSTETP